MRNSLRPSPVERDPESRPLELIQTPTMSLPVCSGRAISYVLKELFQPSRGMRPGFPHILVLVTDGQSQDDVLPPARAAHALGENSLLCFPQFCRNFQEVEVAQLCFPGFSMNFQDAEDGALCEECL